MVDQESSGARHGRANAGRKENQSGTIAEVKILRTWFTDSDGGLPIGATHRRVSLNLRTLSNQRSRSSSSSMTRSPDKTELTKGGCGEV